MFLELNLKMYINVVKMWAKISADQADQQSLRANEWVRITPSD